MEKIIPLNGNIWQVDLEERGIPGWTAAYFIKGEGNRDWMLVETGAASSAGRLLEAADNIGISPEEVKHIGVTHIHVDHAGGLGVISRHFNNAEIWVHPRGEKHLVDPARLIEGSEAVYGIQKMREYGEVLPVPAEKLRPAREGTMIHLGERSIEVWETPGHARHHACFYDHKTKGLFSGDMAGVYAPRLSKLLNQPVLRPATPGPDFHGALMLQDLYRLVFSEVQNIYFTHFGAAAPAKLLVQLVIGQLCVHMHMAKGYLEKEDAVRKLGLALQDEIKKGLHSSMAKKKIDDKDAEIVSNEMKLLMEPLFDSADGLLSYLKRK